MFGPAPALLLAKELNYWCYFQKLLLFLKVNFLALEKCYKCFQQSRTYRLAERIWYRSYDF